MKEEKKKKKKKKERKKQNKTKHKITKKKKTTQQIMIFSKLCRYLNTTSSILKNHHTISQLPNKSQNIPAIFFSLSFSLSLSLSLSLPFPCSHTNRQASIHSGNRKAP